MNINLFPGYNINPIQKKVIYLASAGGMLEFYDFAIYGLFTMYFSTQYFPSNNPLLPILASYGVFVSGYIMRPLGGILFSYIGDRYGRKKVLILTMLLMGIASFGLGLIPTYAQIGIVAPVIMLILRLLQGLAVGGELPSIIVYTTESMPDKRGFALGGTFAGVLCGLLMGILINFILVHNLSIQNLNLFGWRIPFLLGGGLCVVAYKVRRELHETTAFQHMKHNIKATLIELLRHHSMMVLVGVGLVSIASTSVILLIIFMPTYLTKIVKLNQNLVGNVALLAILTAITSAYLSGILSQQYNLYKFTKICLSLIFPSAAMCYYLIYLHSYIYIGIIFFAIFYGALNVLSMICISYIFPQEVRLSGVALSYNIATVIFGGLTPLLVTIIIDKTGWNYTAPLIFILVSTIFAYWGLVKVRKLIYSNILNVRHAENRLR